MIQQKAQTERVDSRNGFNISSPLLLKLSEDPNIVIAKIDVTANEALPPY